jgi:hypothetical protein
MDRRVVGRLVLAFRGVETAAVLGERAGILGELAAAR